MKHAHLNDYRPKALKALTLAALFALIVLSGRALHVCLYEMPPDQPAPFLH